MPGRGHNGESGGRKSSGRASQHPSLLGKGNTTVSLISKSKQKKQENLGHKDRGGTDYNLVAPIRQTASIFKQPVTVYKDHKSRVKSDLKQTAREKPAQLFWTKRLGNLTPASYDDLNENGNEEDSFDDEDLAVIEVKSNKHNILPNKVTMVGPDITETMLLASISTHLHLYKEPAHGQKESSSRIEDNPTAFLNPGQPLMSNYAVSDADIQEWMYKICEYFDRGIIVPSIKAAEERVRRARMRLAQAIKSLG